VARDQLTTRGAATRQRIVAGAAALIRAQGVEHVGLDDIRSATATSKSQLFHYFPDGRGDLLRAVAAHETAAVLADQQPFLNQLGSAETWTAWREVIVRKYAEQGDRCPLTALTRQLSPSDPGIRPIVAELLTEWHRRLADGVRCSQRLAVVDRGLDPNAAAASILAAVQGGVVLMQATGDVGYLEHALDTALAATGLTHEASQR
jgi:AcrR family transcriptional regulator